MQTLASPCSEQNRLRNTCDRPPPLRHTSAGQAAKQTGQREVVRLSNWPCERSGQAPAGVVEVVKAPFFDISPQCKIIATGEAAEAIHGDTSGGDHDGEEETERGPRGGGASESPPQKHPTSNAGSDPSEKRDRRRGIALSGAEHGDDDGQQRRSQQRDKEQNPIQFARRR